LSELYAAALGGSLLFGVNNLLKVVLNVSHVRSDSDRYFTHNLFRHCCYLCLVVIQFSSINLRPVSSGLLLAAAGTGFFDALVYKPLEIIKLKMQVEMRDKPLSFMACARKIMSDGRGVAGLYRGLLPTLLR